MTTNDQIYGELRAIRDENKENGERLARIEVRVQDIKEAREEAREEVTDITKRLDTVEKEQTRLKTKMGLIAGAVGAGVAAVIAWGKHFFEGQ